MTFINYASREINCKIVYYGPGLGGKTTNLNYIYQKIHPANKEDSACTASIEVEAHTNSYFSRDRDPPTQTCENQDNPMPRFRQKLAGMVFTRESLDSSPEDSGFAGVERVDCPLNGRGNLGDSP